MVIPTLVILDAEGHLDLFTTATTSQKGLNRISCAKSGTRSTGSESTVAACQLSKNSDHPLTPPNLSAQTWNLVPLRWKAHGNIGGTADLLVGRDLAPDLSAMICSSIARIRALV